MGIDIVLECTGIFTREKFLKRHIEAGDAKCVILSAPAKGDGVPTTVYGVNTTHGQQIISCASCTIYRACNGNPRAADRHPKSDHDDGACLHRNPGLGRQARQGSSSRSRGGGQPRAGDHRRGAGHSQRIPDFREIFDGVAIRVPVPVDSIADIVCLVARPASVEEVNRIFREEAASDRYLEIVGASEEELVSSDIVGDSRAAIIDLTLTQVVDSDLVKIFTWYDNEWGYAAQLVREVQSVAHMIDD
jgi:glyceraldehyde 3-phosphate dehydrogenase